MDHELAIRSHAPEKYVLGELPAAERDDFEEHLADCSRCMDEVVAADTFAANTRAWFEDEARQAHAPQPKRWFDFLRMRPLLAFSGALNLALLLVVGYVALHVSPSLSPGISRDFVVQGSSRSPANPFTVARGDQFAVFRFDLPQKFGAYSYSMESASGRLRRSGALRISPGGETVNFTVPVAGLEPGDYTVRVAGSDNGRQQEIATWTLRVAP